MSTATLELPTADRRRDRWLLTGSALLTYALGLWIVTCNPLLANMVNRPPLVWNGLSPTQRFLLGIVLLIIGSTPRECLIRITVIASVIQTINYLGMRDDDVDVEANRPYVFWRMAGRFAAAWIPFLRGRSVDRPPSIALTLYERITARYFVVKLLFMPMMIGFFFSTVQNIALMTSTAYGPPRMTVDYIQHVYLTCFDLLMLVDIGWFAIGCSVETGTFSPVKMVDPYPSGWLAAIACYPPMVSIAGQFFVWAAPTFPPGLTTPSSALTYSIIGLFLFTTYVIADLSFGLKTGNLTYRGLVDKGPYRIIRHPMYATKTTAWVVFTIPMLNIHLAHAAIGSLRAPFIDANWALIWPMIAWVGIYCTRAFTEERYLLEFPEYREYVKRVRYRFIPGVI